MRGFLFTVAIFSLAVWVGASGFFAIVVTRAAFAVIPLRPLAGDLVGTVLASLEVGIAAASAIFLLVIVFLRREEEMPLTSRMILSRLPMIALAAALVSRAIVTPRLHDLRQASPAGMTALEKSDPIRKQFDQLHTLSTSLLMAQLLAGLVCASVFGNEIARRTSRREEDRLAPEVPSTLRLGDDSPSPPRPGQPPS